MQKETSRWLRKAEADLIGAGSLAQTRLPVNDQICFFCQQSAEKYIIALVQEPGLVVPRTHDLKALLSLLLPHDATLKQLGRCLGPRNRFAVEIRYPGENARRRDVLAAL